MPAARHTLDAARLYRLAVESAPAGSRLHGVAEEGVPMKQRTFFRYFTDKREVLFSGSKALEKSVVDSITHAPKDAAPLEVVAAAFEAAGSTIENSRAIRYVRERYALVMGHADIHERELMKLAALAAAATKALHARGVTEPTASITAETGVAIFKIGFERWLAEKKPHDFPGHIRAALDALKVATAMTSPARKPKPARRA